MSATSTARVVRFQQRQKAGLIPLSVDVNEAAFTEALLDAGVITDKASRAELAVLASRLIALAIHEQLVKRLIGEQP